MDREDERQEAERALCKRLGIASSPRLGEALTHPSFSNELKPGEPAAPHNQRLEFLGDAVLGLCVSELLVAAFSTQDEGELTVMRASLVSGSALAAVARDVGLAAALRVGRGADATGERHRENVLADALEATVGCVFLDAGLDAARALVGRLLSAEVARLVATGRIERDAKSRLQEILQGRGLGPPRYRVTVEEGPPHAREFTVEVEAGALIASGRGRSKKLAEQAAAGSALEQLRAEQREAGS